MNKFLKAAMAGVSLYAGAACALPDSAFYVGGLLGDSNLEVRAQSIDSTGTGKTYRSQDIQAFSLMIAGGMRFTDSIGIELQVMQSTQPETLFGAVRVNGGQPSAMDLSSGAKGLYGFFQGGEDAFVKVRVGLAQAEASFETDFASASYSTPGLSYGLSIGQKMGGIGAVELLYMHYPKIEVDRFDFADNFGSVNPGFSDRTMVADGLRSQFIALGYIFQF